MKVFCVEKGLFPSDAAGDLDVLILAEGEEAFMLGLKCLLALRGVNVVSDIYPDPLAKSKKQFKYAQKRGTKYIINLHDSTKDTFTLKNMISREQTDYNIDSLVAFFKGK